MTAPEPDADQAITAIYGSEYRSLVRLAVVLVGDVGAAEEIVQDSFVAMRGAWRRLQDRDKALSYLRQSVVARSRSTRRRAAAGPPAPAGAPRLPNAGQQDTGRQDTGRQDTGRQDTARQETAQLARSAVISALRSLPPRQREALVLRFYLDLSEGQAASAMGVSRDAVARHTTRAMAALQDVLKSGS
jgi:RNA polymerase sigma factor (sigma-70 family)